MNKRILGGVMAAGLAFSAFSASAAGLGVSADPLQVGVDDDLTCDSDGVHVQVHFGDHEPGDGRNSNGATVSGISTNCIDEYLTVQALDEDGNRLATQTNTIASGSETVSWDLDPADIFGVEVHING